MPRDAPWWQGDDPSGKCAKSQGFLTQKNLLLKQRTLWIGNKRAHRHGYQIWSTVWNNRSRLDGSPRTTRKPNFNPKAMPRQGRSKPKNNSRRGPKLFCWPIERNAPLNMRVALLELFNFVNHFSVVYVWINLKRC